MKDSIAKIIYGLLIAVVVVLVFCFFNNLFFGETDEEQLHRVLGNFSKIDDPERQQKIDEGIEHGEAAAVYDFAMEFYPNDPVKRLTYITERYLEDGKINDAEHQYSQQAIKEAEAYAESLAEN